MELKKLAGWFKGKQDSDTGESVESLKNELEGQLSALHNAALVSETDVKGNITFVNDTFVEISGYTRQELMGQNHRMLKSGHQPDEIFEEMWRTIAGGRMWAGEIKNRRKDGTYYWVWATITPILHTETGKPYKYVSARFEITKQKEMEQEQRQMIEELRSQEEEIRQTLEEVSATSEQLQGAQKELEAQIAALNNAAIVSETDVKGNITYVNDTFCEISEYSREELLGQNHRILKSGHQPDEIFEEMWQTVARGAVWEGVIKNKKKHGGYYWVQTTVTPVPGPSGKPERYIAVRVDITSEKEKEIQLQQQVEEIQSQDEELRQTMEEMEAINDHLKDTQKELNAQINALDNAAIVSETDVKGTITYVNDTFCEISEYSREELLGQNHRILKSGHQPDEIFEDMWQTISAGSVWRGIVKNKKKHGGYYWVHTTITPVLGENNKPERYIAVRVDITSEKEKEQQLEASDQSIAELNASLRLAKDQLEKRLEAKTTELHDSVLYAQRMQRAIILPPETLYENAPEGYELGVLLQPRDVVGGDYYWSGAWNNRQVLAVGDGTGHGVPGAFMTILAINAMNKLVEERGITEPVALLEEMDTEIKRVLRQEDEEVAQKVHDSLEASVLTFLPDSPTIMAASAMRPMLHVSHTGEMTEYKPSKKSIGGTMEFIDKHFSPMQIPMQTGDTLYLFSDGYADQLGGPGDANKKFGRKSFYQLLVKLNEVDRMRDRTKALYNTLKDWQGFFRDQTDDIVVLMVRKK